MYTEPNQIERVFLDSDNSVLMEVALKSMMKRDRGLRSYYHKRLAQEGIKYCLIALAVISIFGGAAFAAMTAEMCR